MKPHRRHAAPLLVACAAFACAEAPTEPALPLAQASERVVGDSKHGARHPACARVDVSRSTRAQAGVPPASSDTVAKHSSGALGSYQQSFGASAGFGGATGAQSWTQQNTTVDCAGWSIGRSDFLLLEASGTADLRAEAKTAPNASVSTAAEAIADIDFEFTLNHKASYAIQVKLLAEWLAYAQPNAAWPGCARLYGSLERTTPGQEATLQFAGVDVCEENANDPPDENGFLAGGWLPAGSYRVRVGGDWLGGDITARANAGAQASHTFAHGSWAFQFWLEELS